MDGRVRWSREEGQRDDAFRIATSHRPARFLKATVLRLAGNVEEACFPYEELALEGDRREECLRWLETLRP